MHKISIVTAIFNAISNNNGKEYLEQMFKSIHNQDYENIEHLIIDGKSDDGTIEYIDFLKNKYASKPVKIFSEKDSGIYNAMNKGILKSEGEFIAFMNADDYYLENDAITLLYNAIINNENVQFSCSNTAILGIKKKIYLQKADIYSAIYRMPFCHQTMLCKKELFNKYGLFDESYKISADYDFILKIILGAERGIEIDKQLVLFRLGGESYKNIKTNIENVKNILFKFYNRKIITLEECKNLFLQKYNFKLFVKVIFFDILDNKQIKNKYIKKSLLRKLKYTSIIWAIFSIKRFLKFRFIFKPIENYIKKIKQK